MDPAASPLADRDALVRVDAFDLSLDAAEGDGPDDVHYSVHCAAALDARHEPSLPVYERWIARGRLVLRASGVSDATFSAALALDGVPLGAPVAATRTDDGRWSLALTAPLSALASHVGKATRLGLVLGPRGRPLDLVRVRPLSAGKGPAVAAFELREATDAVLFHAPERKLFDLHNPEEGFWLGTGRWRLRLLVDWERLDAEGPDGFALDPRPLDVTVAHDRQSVAPALLLEESARRAGNRRSYTELSLDTSAEGLAATVPPEGCDLHVGLSLTMALQSPAGSPALRLRMERALTLRVRDPRPSLPAFRRLSGVGIDFGTTATVAAYAHKGYRTLMRLGTPPDAQSNAAENPTALLVEDHARLWAEMAAAGPTRRFPNLLRIVQASHAALDQLREHPDAVVTEIKSLPERVVILDQSPLLRDRDHRANFILDEARVRALVRAYAYLLGRAINRPGQDIFLRYFLTYPAQFEERARKLLVEELRAGILLSIPEGIDAAEVTVEMQATEPEAYAAEVCPELAAHPAFAPLLERFGELRFAVFDFGGGTLDIACGRYRPASAEEEAASGCSTVIETLQVAGDDHLGGDYLTHELVWLTHQHDKHLPEMEAREVPMQRPVTIPENKLARAPQLYKRSVAARQNKVAFQRELALERVKFKRDNEVARVGTMVANDVAGQPVTLESLGTDVAGLQSRLARHLEERIADGARLLASMIASTPWDAADAGQTGNAGHWRDKGVVILLAGNSARSEYVERALAAALGAPDLKVWHPSDADAPQGVVRYETAGRIERGAEILGVTPKTAVALGALRIANRDVHLVRAAQGFSYFVGDLRGFPPKFAALLPLGTPPATSDEFGPHYVDFGPWNGQKPLRVAREYEPGRMASTDTRIASIRPELPLDAAGRLYVCAVSPSTIAYHLVCADDRVVRGQINLTPYFS